MAKNATPANNEKTFPDNGKGYSSLGTLSGRLDTLEFKETKNGKSWAQFTIRSGKSKVRGKTFAKKLIPILEGFSEGDEIALFGKVVSNIGNEDKVYTSFVAFSAQDDMDPSKVNVAGEIVALIGTDYGDYVDVEITQDDANPEFVRIRVANELDVSDFEEGKLIRLECEPRGKYGEFTAVASKPFVRSSEKKGSPKASDRFKRTPRPETPAPAAERVATPARRPTGKMTTEDFTKGF